MANAWLAHVKRTMKTHKGKGHKFSAILKMAKKTYHKGKHHGGAGEAPPAGDGAADGADVPVTGGRRRRSSRRTRRHRRR